MLKCAAQISSRPSVCDHEKWQNRTEPSDPILLKLALYQKSPRKVILILDNFLVLCILDKMENGGWIGVNSNLEIQEEKHI